MKLAKETVDDFLKIPAAVSEETEQELADGLENLLQDYITFVATCGSNTNYYQTQREYNNPIVEDRREYVRFLLLLQGLKRTTSQHYHH